MASGHPAEHIFQEAIVPCLADVGDRFDRLELFLPDLIRAGDATKAVQAILQESLHGPALKTQGKVVIGTVFGDVHDIGKDIVVAMLEANGFEVVDLGVSVPTLDFLAKARETSADIVAMSSLLSTSLPLCA